MGVPVVNLIGKTIAGRAGVGILSTVGLQEFAASEAEQFVEIAVSLARDRGRLMELRKTLRERVESSPLMDGRKFAGNVEKAYVAMSLP
jgi:predicted O-linked N-acetylglucosamine transferase (SPINDLY family)